MVARNHLLVSVLAVFLVACGESTVPPTSSVPPTELPPQDTETPTDEPETAEAAEETVPTEEALQTQISIDGDPSDWAGRPILLDDPVGDAEEGFLDLTSVSTFQNHDALYLLVEVADPSASFEEIDFIFEAGPRELLASWSGDDSVVYLGDITVDYEDIGFTPYSEFVLGSALEARIDLRDVEFPETVNLRAVDVMVGECCQPPAWRTADIFDPLPDTPVTDEVDPPEWLVDVPQYALARYFDLPSGWQAEKVAEPPLPDVFSVATSESGVVWVEHNLLSSGLSIVDPDTGEVTRVLDFPWNPWSPLGMVGGPGDSAFAIVGGTEIWQVQPDGSHEVWGATTFGEGAHPTYYTADGRLIGTRYSDPTCVVEMKPDGSTEDIACGFDEIWDVIADQDGTLYVSDWNTGRVVRVNVDGSRDVLSDRLTYRDPIDLRFSPSGDLYVSILEPSFSRLDPATDTLIPLSPTLTECAGYAADFVFADDSRVLFMDPTWGMITWADLDTTTSGVLVPGDGGNSRAAAIGPDDALYFATVGCRGDPPARIVRLSPDGTQTTVIDGLPDLVYDLEFTSDGGMYLTALGPGANHNPIFYVPPGSTEAQPVPDAEDFGVRDLAALPNGNILGWIYRTGRLVEFSPQGMVGERAFQPPGPIEAFSMTFAPDGYLYGFAEIAPEGVHGPTHRQLLRIDVETGQTEIVYQHDTDKFAGGTVSAAPDGTLWVILFPDFELYHVLPDGTATRFARNLPTDAWTINADSQGALYFTSPGGIYRFYQSP